MIACGSRGLGDPHSLKSNLYWGAGYGAEYYLRRAPGFSVLSSTDAPREHVLRELVLTRKPVRVRMLAYDDIDVALRDFFTLAAKNEGGDLLVWAGHDRLMDVPPPSVEPGPGGQRVAILACMAQQYFEPALKNAVPIALTRTLMAPEAYLLEALINTVAVHGVDAKPQIRAALVAAYAKYQGISEKAASSVFSR